MAVFKDTRGNWGFKVRVNGKQYQRSSKKWLKKDAEREEKQFLEQQSNICSKVLTYSEAKKLYIEYYTLKSKPSTVSKLNTVMEQHIDPFYDDYKMNDITLSVIQQWQTYLLEKTYIKSYLEDPFNQDSLVKEERRYSNAFLKNVQSIMKNFLEYCTNFDIIPNNPFKKTFVARHKDLIKDHKEIHLRTKEDYFKYQDACDSLIFKTLESISFWCGLRPGEVLALDISSLLNYDLKTNSVIGDRLIINVNKNFDDKNRRIVASKTYKNRKVDCIKETQDLILELMRYYKSCGVKLNKNTPLFTPEERLSKNGVKRPRINYSKIAKVPYITTQELRHSHASYLISLGWDPLSVAERLGHTVDVLLSTYAHLYEDKKKENINQLENSI